MKKQKKTSRKKAQEAQKRPLAKFSDRELASEQIRRAIVRTDETIARMATARLILVGKQQRRYEELVRLEACL
jgi:hypothetical protein